MLKVLDIRVLLRYFDQLWLPIYTYVSWYTLHGRATLEVIDGKTHQQVLVVEEICLVKAIPQFQGKG